MHIEMMMKKMTLNILKGSKVLVATSTILGLVAYIHPSVSSTKVEDGGSISSSQCYGARLPHEDQKAPTQRTKDGLSKQTLPDRRYVRVDWNMVLPQVNAFIHKKPAENAADCLSRAQEETKAILGSFEKDYDVHVVWEETDKAYPDMTEKYFHYLRQALVIRHMTGTNKEAFESEMRQLKQKIAAEKGVSQ